MPRTGPPDASLQSEQAHYAIIRALAGNDFNAIKYLYDRLNIIDSKASALLRFNSLFFAVFSLIVSARLKSGPGPATTSLMATWWQEAMFACAFVLLLFSTYFCYQMFKLKFDNVTVFPDRLAEKLKAACTCAGKDPSTCTTQPKCDFRTFTDPLTSLSVGWRRTIEDYEKTFFEITIQRQRRLQWALQCTAWSGVLFVLLIAIVATSQMNHLGTWLKEYFWFA